MCIRDARYGVCTVWFVLYLCSPCISRVVRAPGVNSGSCEVVSICLLLPVLLGSSHSAMLRGQAVMAVGRAWCYGVPNSGGEMFCLSAS